MNRGVFPKPYQGALPCLVLGNPADLEIYYWPKVRVQEAGEILTLDALVAARTPDQTTWLLVEIDEGGIVTPESRRREALMKLPTIRLNDVDILRPDCIDRFMQRVRDIIRPAAA
jgi:hypothetical protein